MGHSRQVGQLLILILLSVNCVAQKLPIRIGQGANDTVFNTWSSIDKCGSCIVRNGGLTASAPSNFGLGTATIGKSSGKWYYEVLIDSTNNFEIIGVLNRKAVSTDQNNIAFQLGVPTASVGYRAGAYCVRRNFTGTTATFSGSCSAQAVGAYLGVALDLDLGTIAFYYNGVLQTGASLSGVPAGTWYACYGGGFTLRQVVTANFGQNPWAYAPPAGFNKWIQ
jgi:hypothetical protein